MRFSVELARPGRSVRGRCVLPTRLNARARRCTRYVALRGSFTRVGRVGTNTFRFTGRIAGRRLGRALYRLVALPAGRPARSAARTGFTIAG